MLGIAIWLMGIGWFVIRGLRGAIDGADGCAIGGSELSVESCLFALNPPTVIRAELITGNYRL
jgi:hypothetical protein